MIYSYSNTPSYGNEILAKKSNLTSPIPNQAWNTGCNSYWLYFHLIVALHMWSSSIVWEIFRCLYIYQITISFEYVLKACLGLSSHASISKQSLFCCLSCFLLLICSGLFWLRPGSFNKCQGLHILCFDK